MTNLPAASPRRYFKLTYDFIIDFPQSRRYIHGMPAPMEFLAICMRESRPNPWPTSVAGRFAHAMHFLRRLVLRFGGHDRASGAFVFVALRRVESLASRFADLAAQFDAGTLPPPRPTPGSPRAAPTRVSPAQAAPSRPVDPRRCLPSRFAWLAHWIPVAIHPKSQVARLLAEPELHALLAAAPQAGRILRPLCHMLGIRRPAILDLPKRPRRPPPAIPRRRPAASRPENPSPETPRPEPAPHPFRSIAALQHLWGRHLPRKTA